MNQLKAFDFKGNNVRTVLINDEVHFILNDVVSVLGLSNSRMVKERLTDDVSSTYPIPDSLGRAQQTTVINEDGLYDVILESRKPQARVFRKWVTSEVLPSIRKTGSYNVADPQQLIALALVEANKLLESKDQEIAQLKPKAQFFDQVASSKDAIDIGTAAKVLKVPGVGRNKLFDILRQERILMRNNQPYQTFVDRGYFRVVEQKYTKPNGETHIHIKTLVYQRGLDFIRKTLERSA